MPRTPNPWPKGTPAGRTHDGRIIRWVDGKLVTDPAPQPRKK